MKIRKQWIGSKKPATLGNVSELHEDISLDLHEIKTNMATKEDLKETKKEILHEFKATAENIHKDVAGANRDEILWIKDMIKAIARHVGMPIR